MNGPLEMTRKDETKVNEFEAMAFEQQNFDFQKENIEYRVASLEAFSSNKNPSILLGSLYLIGEYKKRKLV